MNQSRRNTKSAELTRKTLALSKAKTLEQKINLLSEATVILTLLVTSTPKD